MDWLHPKPAAPVISLDSAQAQVTSSDKPLRGQGATEISSFERTLSSDEVGVSQKGDTKGSATSLNDDPQNDVTQDSENAPLENTKEENKLDEHPKLGSSGSEQVSPLSSSKASPEPGTSPGLDKKLTEEPRKEPVEDEPNRANSVPDVGTHDGQLRRSSIAEMQRLGEPQSAVSSEPPFDFQQFLSLMRSRQADPIARYIRSFLQEFCKQAWTPSQQEKIVADFMRFITVKMRNFEPFSNLDNAGRRNAQEGVEKLVMNRLYVRTFPPKMAPILRREGHDDELLRDHVVSQRLRLWSWVEGRHLDINEEYLVPSFLDLACTELRRIHQFRAPRDKMICVLNCSKVVWALIRQAHLEQNADSFLPLLIYVVLQSQPPYIVSNINYIQRFRSKQFRQGETAYYLSTLASAVAFIEGLEKSSLTISDAEFESKMSQACAQEGKGSALPSDSPTPQGIHTPPSSVLAQSAGIVVDRVKRMFEDLSLPENPDVRVPANDGELSPEEIAALQSSRDEYRTQQVREKEFAHVSDTLQQMFPVLDREVIHDVLHQKGTSIGQAVDTCLALVGD